MNAARETKRHAGIVGRYSLLSRLLEINEDCIGDLDSDGISQAKLGQIDMLRHLYGLRGPIDQFERDAVRVRVGR